MKAAVLEEANRLRVRDIRDPVLDPDEILIKVACCGVCGTDLKLYKGEYSADFPLILGHEYSGEVVKIGSKVNNFDIGDRVVTDPNESCGTCYWCRSGQPCFCKDLAAYGLVKDGGFASLTKVSEKGVYSIPDGLDFETASFAEPVSCAVHCIDRAAIKPGDSVLIIGGGPMGQIISQLAKNSGAGDLIMVTRSEWKLRLSETLGCTHGINAESEDVIDRAMQITGGIGADVVIEAVGNPGTMELALRLAKKSGRVVIFGFIPEGIQARFIPFDILSRELTVMGSWVNPFTFNRALAVLEKGEIDVRSLISHKFTLENILESLEMMMEKPAGFIKALINIKS